MHLGKWLVSFSLLGIFLMPSPRILDPERTHKRHATCEHHLRRHHPDPAERAKILRRAERRKRRLEEQARIEQERARAVVVAAQPTSGDQDDAAAQVAEALDESNLQPCQAAADPQDDDSRMKKGRRPARIKTLFWSLQEPPKIRPAGEFLAMLRAHILPDRTRALSVADVLPHFGSGPCHSIPRPREGTDLAEFPCRGVVA